MQDRPSRVRSAVGQTLTKGPLMKDVLRLAVFGCGSMGSGLAEEAHELDHAHIVAVADVAEERASELAEKVQAEPFTSYSNVLNRDDIDAVIIASPPFMHRAMVEASAKAGKHIFCEKPMAPTVAQCDSMIASIQRYGVKFQIGHVCRFHATHGKVRDLVTSGDFGTPTTILVHRIGGPWGSDHPEWRNRRDGSGGLLLEVNAHELDFMRYVCGDVVGVSAMGGTYVTKELDYPDAQVMLLHFANGAVGCLHSSLTSAISGYGGRVDCSEGSIVFPAFWGDSASIQTKRFDGEVEEIAIKDIDVEKPVRAELRAFVDAVLTDTETPISMWDGRAVVRIAEAGYRSIAQGGSLVAIKN